MQYAARQLAYALSWLVYLVRWIVFVSVLVIGPVLVVECFFALPVATSILDEVFVITQVSPGHYEIAGQSCRWVVLFATALMLVLAYPGSRPRRPAPPEVFSMWDCLTQRTLPARWPDDNANADGDSDATIVLPRQIDGVPADVELAAAVAAAPPSITHHHQEDETLENTATEPDLNYVPPGYSRDVGFRPRELLAKIAAQINAPDASAPAQEPSYSETLGFNPEAILDALGQGWWAPPPTPEPVLKLAIDKSYREHRFSKIAISPPGMAHPYAGPPAPEPAEAPTLEFVYAPAAFGARPAQTTPAPRAPFHDDLGIPRKTRQTVPT